MTLPFDWYDAQLLEGLAELLPEYLDIEKTQEVLGRLRCQLVDRNVNSGERIRQIHTLVKHCRRCPAVTSEPYLPSWNVTNPDVVFVADTTITDKAEAAFLIDCLQSAGFHSATTTLTSLTRCRPAEQRPSVPEIQNCAPYLYQEIALWVPKLIVALGSSVAQEFVGEMKITVTHGNIYWVGPWATLVTYNPAYVMRSGREDQFATDLSQAHAFVYGR